MGLHILSAGEITLPRQAHAPPAALDMQVFLFLLLHLSSVFVFLCTHSSLHVKLFPLSYYTLRNILCLIHMMKINKNCLYSDQSVLLHKAMTSLPMTLHSTQV